jgi:2-keto-4-pentenoate hydratase
MGAIPESPGPVAHEEAARRLRAAYWGDAVEPLRDLLEPGDIDGAYAVQAINTRLWQAEGRTIVGRKIGLTSAAVQQQLGVDRPDFGVLFDDMRIANGGELPFGRLIQGKIEAEIALILGQDLPDRRTGPDQVLESVARAAPALEIVDSRIAEWRITFADTVADNGSSAFFVLGDELDTFRGLDLRACEMVMRVDGEVVSSGTGAACLGHPLEAAAWLARTLAERGEPLAAGDIILTGALGPMATLREGMRVEAEIGGLGSVSCRIDGDLR